MTDDHATDATERIVAEVNRVHGLRFALRGRADGGFQVGAWLLADATGRRAVLKWNANGSAVRIERLALTVERLRATGYPTPRWLAAGVTTDGMAYHVQEFVRGTPATPLTARNVDALVDVLERHRGLAPAHGPDRSPAIAGTASTGVPRATVRRLGPAGRALVDHYDALLARVRPVELPGGDLVHGDFNSCNILLDRGTVSGVIDVEGLGGGTRVIDYACLLREAYVEAYESAVALRLRAAAQRIAGPGVLAWCAARTAFDIVGFKLQHQPDRVGSTLARLHRLADDLAEPA